jgi:ABC-type glycerol-3-phosphate transport system substrate-binding protein
MFKTTTRRGYLRTLAGGGAALTAGVLAACGGPSAGDSAPQPAKGPVKLLLLHAWNEARLPMMDKMRDDFQKKYPNISYEYDLTTTAQGLNSPRVQKLVTAVAGGSPPDVTMIWRGEVPGLAVQSTLQPIDSLISRDKFDTKIYYDAEWQTSRYQGKAYVLPNVSAGGWFLVHYNRDHLKEGGYGADQMPTTWAQATDYLKKLTKVEGGRITRLGGARAGGVGGFILYALNNKGKYLSDDGKKVLFDSPETIETIEWWQSFYEPVGGSAAVATFSQTYPTTAAQSPFTTGNQSMNITNPSQIFHIKANNPTLDFGVALPPYGPKDNGGKSYIRGGWSYGIPTGAKYASESWELVKWLSATKEASGWFMQEQLRPSPMKAVNEDKYYVEKLPQAWPQLLKAMEKDVAVPVTPVDGEIDKVLNQLMTDVDAKKGSVRDLLKQAATDIQRELDTFWARQGK